MRLRYISILPLVRHILRLPADNSLLTKLIDATEPLAVRDQDGDVITAMNQFYSKFGLLHLPTCCQPQPVKEFGLEIDSKTLKSSNSLDSLTDEYLIDIPNWERLDIELLDRQKEEEEHKLLLFQLDPSKKKEDIKASKLHAAAKKSELPAKKVPLKKYSIDAKTISTTKKKGISFSNEIQILIYPMAKMKSNLLKLTVEKSNKSPDPSRMLM